MIHIPASVESFAPAVHETAQSASRCCSRRWRASHFRERYGSPPRHIADFINLFEVRWFDGIILRCQTLYHIAESYHRVSTRRLRIKPRTNKKNIKAVRPTIASESARGDFSVACCMALFCSPFQQQAEMIDLRLHPLQLLLIRLTVNLQNRLFLRHERRDRWRPAVHLVIHRQYAGRRATAPLLLAGANIFFYV